ncbi:MAG: DegT/DnrJ/EryC1/StrS family aminotransferase [Acidobacteriaceae bacterium]
MVPLSAPDILEPEIAAVVEVLRGTRLSIGPRTDAFEAAMAAYIGVPYAIAVSSGTAGLHLCVRALGIGEGDEVIVPSFAFIAVANVVRYERATPVFVDIDLTTLNLDPEKVEAAITPRTKAILVVHTFGVPAEMAALLEIAQRHHLRVIEDACEAIGAEYDDKKAGSFGDAAVFAFYPNKQITTGEGGMIVTRDPALARKMRALRNQGRYETDDWFQHEELGYNYRISEINCALGLEQLRRIGPILARREAVARAYTGFLHANVDLVLPPLGLPRRRISWFVYVVRLHGRFTQAQRDAVLRGLTAQGIGCGRYFAPIHLQPSYAAWRGPACLPVTEFHATRTIALPFFNRITETEIGQVCLALDTAMQKVDGKEMQC